MRKLPWVFAPLALLAAAIAGSDSGCADTAGDCMLTLTCAPDAGAGAASAAGGAGGMGGSSAHGSTSGSSAHASSGSSSASSSGSGTGTGGAGGAATCPDGVNFGPSAAADAGDGGDAADGVGDGAVPGAIDMSQALTVAWDPAIGANGGVFVAGSFSGTLTLGMYTLVAEIPNQAFFAWLDVDLKVIDAKTYPVTYLGGAVDTANGVAVVAGNYSPLVPYTFTLGQCVPPDGGADAGDGGDAGGGVDTNDFFVLAFDAMCHTPTNIQSYPVGATRAAVAISTSKVVAIAGDTTNPNLPFGSPITSPALGPQNAFVALFDEQALASQSRIFGAPNSHDWATGVAFDATGDNLVVTGSFDTAFQFDADFAGYDLAGSGSRDAFVIELGEDPLLSPAWSASVGGPGAREGMAVAAATNMDLVVAVGSYETAVDVGISNGGGAGGADGGGNGGAGGAGGGGTVGGLFAVAISPGVMGNSATVKWSREFPFTAGAFAGGNVPQAGAPGLAISASNVTFAGWTTGAIDFTSASGADAGADAGDASADAGSEFLLTPTGQTAFWVQLGPAMGTTQNAWFSAAGASPAAATSIAFMGLAETTFIAGAFTGSLSGPVNTLVGDASVEEAFVVEVCAP